MHHHAHSYTVISIDIVNSSEGGSLRHTRLLVGLHKAVHASVADCPLGEKWVLRRDGDSMTIAVPPAVSKGEVLGEFPHRLDRELRRFNAERTPQAQLRIRMAVAHGDVVVDGDQLLGGDGLVEAARVRDITPLRLAMDAAPDAYIGLVLPDAVYRTSVRDGDPALMPHAYRQVRASSKRYEGTAWIRLIGVDPPRDGDGGPREAVPAEPGSVPRDGDAAPSAGDAAPSAGDAAPSAGDTYNTSIDTANGPLAIGRHARAGTSDGS
ncbi:hypothetical protein AB0B85_31145 [Micromonospora sp. NPDC049044]|uniref:hypothetical protein n=1 Tax=Micromonospora sp. NPDC049044 TaxID=3154827 RepID=UPI0033E58203